MPHDASDSHKAPPAAAKEPGDLVGQVVGNYRVLDYLGSGGMGAVYLAEHSRIGQAVALKVLHLDLASDAKQVRRFEDEARAAARAGHRNIVQVFDFGELPDGRSYFVMERLKGRSLAALVAGGGMLPVVQALTITREIALALGAAHRSGVVHRDLKPDNVFLVDEDGDTVSVKVLDFGIAKLQRDPGRKGLTEAGLVFGTPQYMSPEQASGSGDLDGRADLYSLGVVLYEMLAGTVPFKGQPGEVLARHILKEPPDPRERRADLPDAVAEFVLRCLRKVPAERFANAEELVAELAKLGVGPSQSAGTLRSMQALLSGTGPARAAMAATVASGGVSAVNPAAAVAEAATMASPARGTGMPLGGPAGTGGVGVGARPAPRHVGTGETGANMAAEAFVASAPPRGRSGLLLGLALGVLLVGGGAAGLWWFGGLDAAPGRSDGSDDGGGGGHDRPRAGKKARGADGEGAKAAGDTATAAATASTSTGATAAAPAKIVLVKVSSDPPRAEITVAGEDAPRGTTPMSIEVAEGERREVTLRLAGHADMVATLDPLTSKDVSVKLEPLATAKSKAPRKTAKPAAAGDTTPDKVRKDATLKPSF
ncbi:MAG TPA: serine/threonine-protein kinase [Myxococcota bacterium]|jgi:serine/threonine-protein kinase|nr:serine/threonine-protein kinase [Myxococcota bacterium]